MVRPLNDATMALRPSPIPYDAGAILLPAWLAFCSTPYLEDWSQGRMEKLLDLQRTQRREALLVPCSLKQGIGAPSLPAELITYDPDDRSLTNEWFRVEEWQEYAGYSWPKRWVFHLYQSHSEPKGELVTVGEWSTTELFLPQAELGGKPQLTGRQDVKDERFTKDSVALPLVSYFTTNSAVPPPDSVRAMRQYDAQVEYERTRTRSRVPWTWHLVFWPALTAPLIWFLVRSQFNKQHGKP
jgi:hypothetical protein